MCVCAIHKTSEFVFFSVHDILIILLINHISAASTFFKACGQGAPFTSVKKY